MAACHTLNIANLVTAVFIISFIIKALVKQVFVPGKAFSPGANVIKLFTAVSYEFFQ